MWLRPGWESNVGHITKRDWEYSPLAIPAPWVIDEKSRRERRPAQEEARLELPRAQEETLERENDDSPQSDGVIIIDL